MTHRNVAQRDEYVRAGNFKGNTLKRRTGRLYLILEGVKTKLETRLKKALETPEPKTRLLKLIGVCMRAPSGCTIWEQAHAEIDRLYKQGVKL